MFLTKQSSSSVNLNKIKQLKSKAPTVKT